MRAFQVMNAPSFMNTIMSAMMPAKIIMMRNWRIRPRNWPRITSMPTCAPIRRPIGATKKVSQTMTNLAISSDQASASFMT